MMKPKDSFSWLEEIESPKSLNWVEDENKKADQWFAKNKNFKSRKDLALKILESKDRIIPVQSYGDSYVYNFWKDEVNTRGLLRRATRKSFLTGSPKWETILDIDQLSKNENENWVYKGQIVFEPKNQKSLMLLSKGGKDAVVVREFDLIKKQFVTNGFYISESKTKVAWVNEDLILVATDFGPNSMTTSGYPRIVKALSRGDKLSQAKYLFEAETSDMSVEVFTKFLNDGSSIQFLSKVKDFYNDSKYFINKDLKIIELEIPLNFEVMGMFEKTYLLKSRIETKILDKIIPSGSLVALNFDQNTGKIKDFKIIFQADKNQSLNSVHVSKNNLILNVLEDVKTRIYISSLKDVTNLKPFEDNTFNTYQIIDSHSGSDEIFYMTENFITPSKMYILNLTTKDKKIVQSKKNDFDSKDLIVKQNWVVSPDGTKVPYFIIHKKSLKMDSKNRTLLYGYGGFEIALEPFYLSSIGKIWLEEGGVYVLANIRGGGEFGPQWHQAALKQNRHKAFEDFIAVAEDLIERKITSPKKLAIQGGSNGGLLVGSVMTQRPELFGAVVCLVPLLDMLKYHKLLAGASWMAEYGDPSKSEEYNYLKSYSPYQNLDSKKIYPPLFLYTSTKDDRVHPGHARKMAARMKDLNKDVIYYENQEGGHAGSTNFDQRSKLQAMIFTFLEEKLK